MRIGQTTFGALATLLLCVPARVAFADPSSEQAPDRGQADDECRALEKADAATHDPKLLGGIGLCKLRLERDGEAVDAYARYLEQVPDLGPEERAQIGKDLQVLTVGVGRLSIAIDHPGVVLTDVRFPSKGERIVNAYGPVDGSTELRVRAGRHVITAKLAGYDDATWALDVFASSRSHHSFAMLPAGQTPRARPSGKTASSYGPWVVMGVGTALASAGAASGIAAADLSEGLDAVTGVLLFGGGVIAIGGLVWFLLGRDPGPPDPATTGSALLFVPSAACAPSGCRAALRWSF